MALVWKMSLRSETAILAFSWHDYGIDVQASTAHELDVAASLAGLAKSDGLEAALDFAEWERLKPPQPRPRWYAP